MDNLNVENIDSFFFSIPINDNINFLNTINNLHENIINIININNNENNNEFIQFNLEFEYYSPIKDELKPYFKNCNEINNCLCKPEKIKKNDNILKENCFICMENYVSNEFKRVLPNCNHYFHKRCIDKWLKTNATCPICRDNLIK